jgi:hypothetical protein
MKSTIFPLLAAILLPLSACGGAPYYTAAPIEAWVVDAETNQPIEGAVVVANWQLVVGSLDGQRYKGQLEVKETVTDKAGRFHFEGFTKANPMLYELRGEDPKIIIFKAGYEYKKVVNNYPKGGTETPGTKRKAEVNGQTVKLEKVRPLTVRPSPTFTSTTFYFGLSTQLLPIVEDCEWKKTPRMILEMGAEKKRLKKIDISHSVDVDVIAIDDIASYSPPGCGSAAEFFKGYAK